ncbi:integrase [Neorhizobium galegae]|uniref:integrase n=1 Tax=Neorhizobium galegae TaxID=399 RepID=UPI0021056481|nr:integrase [Neorhizobium galegae]MCQ1779439.1 integrase [Neorhizobium galegae]MCQ1795599.1 integrase [Neorhizobium galegae]
MNAHNPFQFNKTGTHQQMWYLADAKYVHVEGIKYTVVEQNAKTNVFRNPDGVIQEFTHDQLLLKHLENKLFVEKQLAGHPTLKIGGDMVDFPLHKVRRAMYLTDALDLFLEMHLKKDHALALASGWEKKVTTGRDCLAVILPAIRSAISLKWTVTKGASESTIPKLPNERQFKRLFDLYVASDCDSMALVSRRTGPGSRAADAHPLDQELWVKHARLYADPKCPSMRACLESLRAEVELLNAKLERGGRRFNMPSRNAFETLIKGMGEYFLHCARHGEAAAMKKFAPVRQGLRIRAPGERIEMDEWKIDLHSLMAFTDVLQTLNVEQRAALKKIRVWVTVAIDVATRCILALRFSTRAPSAHSSLAALEMVVTSKEHIAEVAGALSRWHHALTPRQIFTDAGAGFIDARFRAAVASLHCKHVIPPAGMPSARGTIESVFRTFGQRFMHYFHGRTFSSIDEKGDYKSDANAVLNIDELCRYLTRAIVDIYHHEPHSGLGGETPANAWLRLSREYAVIPPINQSQRRRIFGTLIKRKLSQRGIVFLGIHYNSPALQRLWADRSALPHSQTPSVNVRVDRFNVRTISYHDDEQWIDLSTELQIPDDVSVWEWTEAADNLAKAHRKNVPMKLSTVLATINDLREAGNAAAARAELGTDIISAEAYRKVEMSRWGYDITDDIINEKALSRLSVAHNPITTSVEEFRFLVRNTEEQNAYFAKSEREYPASEAAQKKAKQGDSSLEIDFDD